MPEMNDALGYPAGVLINGFQMTYTAMMSMAAHSADNEDSYTAIYSGDPGGTDADFFYMKNTSDMFLRIHKIKVYCTADVEITIKTGVTGTPTNTTEVTPVNSLVGSGNTADMDCYSRAGDLALTGGNTHDSLIYDAACNREIVYTFSEEITLKKNQALVFNNVTDPNAAIRMTVYFYFHEKVQKP